MSEVQQSDMDEKPITSNSKPPPSAFDRLPDEIIEQYVSPLSVLESVVINVLLVIESSN